MDKKSQLQVLCEEKIPLLVNGVSLEEVFKDCERSQPEKKIEKPWAVFDSEEILKVVGEEKTHILVKNYDNQRTSRILGNDWVRRFKTVDGVIKFVLTNNNYRVVSKQAFRERVYFDFPETTRQEYLHRLGTVLVSRKNSLLAQSPPKCKEEVPRIFNLCGHYNDPAAGSYKSHGH